MSAAGIYFHIPFCLRKCGYCDFYSAAPQGDVPERYTQALIRRLKKYPAGLAADTVYFGGGTPSLLSPAQIEEILFACRSHFSLSASAEISLEANPKTAGAQKLEGFLRAGITRLSVGIQSMNDNELQRLGRLHTAQEAQDFVYMAKNVGFENISCDIMLGIPEQTRESAHLTAEEICRLPLTHISLYMLKIEENTPFASMQKLPLPDEDTLCEIYLSTAEYFGAQGFAQYEISNFAKAGFQCRHNLKYWRCGEYIGIGAAAHSFFGGVRYAAKKDTAAFISGIDSEYITDSQGGGRDEQIMLGLRLAEGIPESLIPASTAHMCGKFIEAGLMLRSGGQIRLSPEGFLISNDIISSLLA